jgi:hypothetical protein
MKDLHSVVRTLEALAPAALTTAAGRAGKIIDRQGYGGIEFLVNWGTVTATAATIAVVLKEGDVTGTLTSVADANLLGTELLAGLPAATRTSGTGKNFTTRLGYSGTKRYVQLSIGTATTTAATIASATALLHSPNVAPTVNP